MKQILLAATALFLSAGLMAQTVYLSEDFESGIPSSWSQSTLSNDGGWNAGNSTSLSSGSFPIEAHGNFIATNDDACNCDKSADTIFTDTVDLASAAGLTVLSFDMFYFELTYSGATEDLDVMIYSEANSSWTLLQDMDAASTTAFEWLDNVMIDISSYAGDQVVVAFVYNDGSCWTYGAAIDNVSIYEAAQHDVANLSVDNGIYQEVNTSTNITGTVQNMGSATITSLEMSYTVDGGSAVSATLTVLSIAPLATYSYSHPTTWTPTVEQLSTVVTSVGAVNGNQDANASNDEASLDILVHPTPVTRKPILEQFTSSTCPPCTPGNANVLSVMSNYSGEYSKVNYQMSWPGTGDPYYTLEGLDRRTFYGVNSVPSMHTDGSAGLNSNSYTAATFENAQAVPAFVNMAVEGTIQPEFEYEVQNGQLVKVDSMYHLATSVDINPIVDLPAGQVAFISLNENLTYNNIKTNGETEFHDVMKKMLPDAQGTTLSAIAADDTYTVEESHTFPGAYRLPNDANDPIVHAIEHSIEEWDDLRVVAWVQNTSTGSIWQSENVEVTMLEPLTNVSTDTIDGEVVYTVNGESYVMWDGQLAPLGVNEANVALISVYPNPASDMITISGVSGMTQVTVFDASGRVVLASTIDRSTLDVSELEAGVYSISIVNNGAKKVEKVTIAH
jgi:thiol-disulfide isomerase/thioredoxin